MGEKAKEEKKVKKMLVLCIYGYPSICGWTEVCLPLYGCQPGFGTHGASFLALVTASALVTAQCALSRIPCTYVLVFSVHV
jgi:hypothetical protein